LRERAISRGWQLETSGNADWSKGSFIGTSDQHNEVHLYSPFIRNRWRIFADEWFDNGNFARGNVTRQRSALGIRYGYERQSIWGEVAGDTGTAGSTIAGSVGADIGFADHWTLRGEADSDNLSEVQLIAALGSVRARGVNLNLGWHANELRAGTVGLQRLLFTDGNQRLILSGEWNEQIHRSPHLDVNLSPQVWASFNSMNENRVYFNPKEEFSAGPQVAIDWITWRRYERSFHQQLTAYVAPQWQQNYGAGPAGSMSYVQAWKLSDRFGLNCGVAWNSQPYDGSNESYTALKYGITFGSQ
jgi:biofilm PGA synthesis protein PgaA